MRKLLLLISLCIISFIFTTISAAWLVRNALTGGDFLSESQKNFIIQVSRLPGFVNIAINSMGNLLPNQPTTLLIDRKSTEKKYWTRSFPSKDDPGYLIFSGLEAGASKSTVSLIKISNGEIIKKWSPDWNYIINKTTPSKFSMAGRNEGEMRAFHPLLLGDGGIIFNTGGSLVRMGVCSNRPEWVLDEISHHSVEADRAGNIWTVSTSSGGFEDNKTLDGEIREDAIAELDMSGNLINRISFIKILRNNNFSWLFMGMNGFNIHRDPVHLNQISIASEGGDFWRAGDLLLSARHLSTIFIYRPSSGKIIWSQSGPWMNQHSARFINNHQISVFDNNVYSGAPIEQPFLKPGDNNRLLVYDFKTRAIAEPFEELLKQERPATLTEGRAEILPDGGLFIEESNQGRHLRFSKEKLLWSRVNDYDKNSIGIVSWSRYMTSSEASGAIMAISKSKCE